MNHIYIGDRQLDPEEDNGCEFCDGLTTIANLALMRNDPCPHCRPDEVDPEPDCDPDL